MVYLGIDLGARRIGFAVADAECPVATVLPLAAVRSPEEALRAVVRVFQETGADVAVLGLPLDLSGHRGLKAREAETFAEKLRAAGLTVELWDERLTTEEVRRVMAGAGVSRKDRKGVIDSLAAQRILSSYLAAKSAPGAGQ